MVSWQVLGEQAVRLSIADRLALLWKIVRSLFVPGQVGFSRQVGSQSVQERLDLQASEESWRNEPAFGLWRDREDMKDSVQWVRELREREWGSRQGSIDAN